MVLELQQPPLEFGRITAYLQESSRDREPMTAGQIRAYYDLLADIPIPVLEAAARRVMMTHTYPTVPTPAAIRRAALELTEASVPVGDAWRMVMDAASGGGMRDPERTLKSLPPTVAAAARSYGWRAICDLTPAGHSTAYAQFRDIYQSAEERRRTEAALPPSLRSGSLPAAPGMVQVEATTRGALPTSVRAIVGGIGQAVNGVGLRDPV